MGETQRLTVKQRALLFNVSERGIYKAQVIQKLRPDLGEQIMAGTISQDAAYRIATGKPKATSWDHLATAFLASTDEDKAKLMDLLDAANLQPDEVRHG